MFRAMKDLLFGPGGKAPPPAKAARPEVCPPPAAPVVSAPGCWRLGDPVFPLHIYEVGGNRRGETRGSELACFLKGGKARGKPPDIIRAGCWAHVRRKFFDGARDGCLICKRLLKLINVLYRIEGVARESGLSPAERAALRQRRSRRVIAKLRRRMDQVIAKERPKSRAASACLYAMGQWKPLLVFLERGEVEIDNNSIENAIRPCALGRKNRLCVSRKEVSDVKRAAA